jgi:ATP-binding cassette subfamily B protein
MTAPQILRRVWGNIGVLVQLAWTAAPRLAGASLLLQLLGAATLLLCSYQVKIVVAAAATGPAVTAALMGVGLASLGGAAWAIGLCSARLLPRISDAVSGQIDEELIRRTASIRRLEHAEGAVLADKVHLIRGSSQQLAQGVHALVLSLRSVMMLGGTFGILVALDPRLGWLPLFSVPRILAGQRAHRIWGTAQQELAEPRRLREEIFRHATSPAAWKEVRILGLGDELAHRFAAITANSRVVNGRANLAVVFWSSLGDVAFVAGCIFSVAVLAIGAANGTVSLADVALGITLISGLILQTSSAMQFAQQLQMSLRVAEQYASLADALAIEHSPPGPFAATPGRLTTGLRMENVSFCYPGQGDPVLADLSFTLPAGAVVALVGENGSGKSTLVNLLCALYRPTSGRILVDGVDLADIGSDVWLRRVCGAFQDYLRLEVTLGESVGVGDLAHLGDHARAISALNRAGGGDLLQLGSGGPNMLLGRVWGGVDLSGGQWQKVALGRSIVRDAPLLSVFDEPGAALDAASEYLMFERVAAEARSPRAAGGTTLLVSHRFSTVRMADVIAVMERGRIVEVGDHRSLMAAGEKYAALFEQQAKAYR